MHVIGGSIGGLTAALVLRDAGCDVHVYERSDADLVGRGAGIVVHPMTVRYFAENNVLELDRISVPSRTLRYINSDGTVAYEEQVNYRLTAWNTLYRALRACLEPDRYHLGQNLLLLLLVQDLYHNHLLVLYKLGSSHSHNHIGLYNRNYNK